MKKVILIVFSVIAVCAAVWLFLTLRPSASDYEPSSFSLEHEPDSIFASKASDNLLICIDGEIREYRPDGRYFTLDINAQIKSAYPDERKTWYIDTNNCLYRFEAVKETLVLENVKYFSIGSGGYAAVAGNGDVCFWNSESEKPLCIGNVPNAEKLSLGYTCGHNYALVLDAENQVYECVFPDDESSPFELKKIDELKSVEDIFSGYGNIAVTNSGEVHYWLDSFGSGQKSPYMDSPSDIEQECNELGLVKFSLSHSFDVGLSKNGEVYFWGEDRFRSPNDKSIKYVYSPERIKFITGADDVFSGSSVIYFKSGTTIDVIKYVY